MTLRYPIVIAMLVAAGTVSAAAQAARSATYPPAVVTTYEKSCRSVARVATKGKVSEKRIAAYCVCTLRYLERHLTYPEFKAADRAAITLSGGSAKAKRAFKGAVATCGSQIKA